MVDKLRLCEILEQKLEEGYDCITEMKMSDSNFASSVTNMFQIEKTIKELTEQDNYDKAILEDPIKVQSNEEIEKALAKNMEIEVKECE